MGKTKTKYPVEITIQFVHPVIRESYNQKVVSMKMSSSPLRYIHFQKVYKQFLEEFNILTPAVLQWISDDNRQQIKQNFEIDVGRILDEFGGTFTIIVQSYVQVLIEQINQDIGNIYQEIEFIKDRLNDLPTREEFMAVRKSPVPVLTHNQSNIVPINIPDKKLDIGILFSEPIFDQLRKKPAANPVDFRSQIQRLNTALKSSIKSDINIKCEIATKQNLKHFIKFLQPKILHIICHGTSQGALEFQDDSRTVLGALQIVKTDEIIQTLRSCVQNLPQVVFVNSCYSQRVGQAFFQMGVGYVIAIDSQDTIQDEAAQIFSQHFYRNIFSGEKVKQAFIQAKQRVKMKHNSFGCCCRHSSKQKHKKSCRWLQMIRRGTGSSESIDQQQKLQKHKLFHVPSELCKCELKHLNRHKLSCEWARQALFHINNDFRIPDGDSFRFPKFKSQFPTYLPKDQLVICCCFNYQSTEDSNTNQFRLPHSESNKFKIFENKQIAKNQVVFDISNSAGKQLYKQINDYTAPQLLQTHQKIESSIMGRQREIYEFIKRVKDLNQSVYIVYGPVGVGRTSFVLKCVTYLIQRRVFELYFYIDLYGIKDRDIFRYKFNQITKFNYDGEVKVTQVKNKMMVVILDNADDFFQLQGNQLYDQLKNLRQELHKTKIILTFKQENCSAFDFERVHSEKYALQPLTIQAATKLIFSKMRHLFDITVQYNQIDGIVRSNQALRIPKFIQSLCQSFSSVKKKIKIGEIKKKLETILQGDMGGNKLIEENLKTLKERSEASYNLLLFMSQFAEGLSFDDFKWLSIYQKKDSKIHLPIGKNWQTVFATLFEKKYTSQEYQRQQSDSNLTQDSDLSNPSLKNIYSINNYHKESTTENGKQGQSFISKQSYFLDQISKDRYIVKRFIRDFIWKKHESPQNYYMKHLFVGYMAVMLQIYFKWLVNSKYIHEDLVQYSSVSEAGLFGFKNNVFNATCSLTQSVRIARQYNSEFQRLISEHPTVVDKIRKSDPSIFVAHHKQDFLNIYEKRWDVVFQFLKEKKAIQDKICIGYLENLMLFIPTAFKIAKVENSLLKYIISKSMSLLQRLRKYSQSQNYSQNQKILAIQLKLQLMRASIDLQRMDMQTLKNELELNKQMVIKLVKSIDDNQIIEYMRKYWSFQKTYMLMYKQYITRRQSATKSYIDKNKSLNEKLKLMVESVVLWLGENWDQAEEILTAKRNLIIGLMYLSVLKLYSGGINLHTNPLRLKKQHQKTILKLLNQSAYYFKAQNLMKLCLRAKLTYIQIFVAQIINPKKKAVKTQQFSSNQNSQLYQDLTETQKKTQQCENIYTDRKNNLIGFMEFDNEIKSLKKLLKQKFWQISSNTLVCMRPVPLTINGETPIIQNLVRKKNKFRKEIQKIVNPQIDLCSKFQILTASKLKEEVQNGCTMLLLTSNVKIYEKRPFLVFQGVRMEEDLVEIDQNFVQQYDLSKIKVCMIVGNNSYEAIRELSKILQDPPILISLGNSTHNKYDEESSKDPNDYKKPKDLQIFAIEDKRKVQIEFLKMFVKMLMDTEINSKEQILQICSDCEHIVKGILELRVLSQKRVSPIEIKHKKGTYKDLSPGYQKNHNIDMKLKTTDHTMNFICLRRWKDTYRVLQHIRTQSQTAKLTESNPQKVSNPAAYINVFGDIGSGKSLFVQQMARLFVQRQRYSSGVYIIDGKLLQKKYQGEFENYFTKQSEIGKFMTLQDFEQDGNENLMLIIDDFHMIKPKSNGRFNLFLQKIVDKRVNLIIVTNNQYSEKTPTQDKKKYKRIFENMRGIKMQRLCPLEIDLIASNILDLRNQRLLQRYEELKQANYGDIRVQDIMDLKVAFYGKKNKHEFMGLDSKEMKKMQSNRG